LHSPKILVRASSKVQIYRSLSEPSFYLVDNFEGAGRCQNVGIFEAAGEGAAVVEEGAEEVVAEAARDLKQRSPRRRIFLT
jgi:hypothetical protein